MTIICSSITMFKEIIIIGPKVQYIIIITQLKACYISYTRISTH